MKKDGLHDSVGFTHGTGAWIMSKEERLKEYKKNGYEVKKTKKGTFITKKL